MDRVCRRQRLRAALTTVLLLLVVASAAGIAAAETTDQEPNDDREDAQQIEPGETVTGDVRENGDTDVYTFSVEAGSTINVTAYAAEGATEVSLKLPDGSNPDSTRLDDQTDSVGVTARETGAYSVEINGVSDDTGSDYEFTVATSTTDAFEPNEDAETAFPLYEHPFTPSRGTITIGDSDVFTFEAAAGDTVGVWGWAADDGSTEFSMIDPTGDNYESFRLTGEEDTSTTTASTGGTYRLEINGVSWDSGSDYEFRVTRAGEPLGLPNDRFERPHAPEGNQDRERAAALDPGSYEDLGMVGDDRDVFAVELAAGEHLNATVDAADDGSDLALALTDDEGDELASTDGSTDGDGLGFNTSDGGTFYLVVTGSEDASTTYDLELATEGGDGGGDGSPATGADDEGPSDGAEDESPSEGQGPGFGAAVALIAVAVSAAVAVRR